MKTFPIDSPNIKRTRLNFTLFFLFCLAFHCHGDSYGDFTYSVSGTNVTITRYTGSATDITIPDNIPDVGTVTIIGDGSFSGTKLTNVLIPNSVKIIGDYAFWDCALLFVVIPNSVTVIGYGSFGSCKGLSNITIPNSVTNIGDEAFSYCTNLTNVTIPSGVKVIGDNAFCGCNLSSVTIPDTVKRIGTSAFNCDKLSVINVDTNNSAYCSSNGVLFTKNLAYLVQYPCGLEGTYSIPSGVKSIWDSAFSGCRNLTSIDIPDSVLIIGNNAFNSCTNLGYVNIGNGVTNIGESAFSTCLGLTNVIFGNSVVSIGRDAFSETSLTSVIIPSSVKRIGSYAFYSLSYIYFLGDAPTLGEGEYADEPYVFNKSTALGFTIYYPSTALGWMSPFWNGYWTEPYDLPSAPTLPTQTNLVIGELTQMTVTNAAINLDKYVQVTYALLEAPDGARIDFNGIITWIPSEVQGPGTYTITTIATSFTSNELAILQSSATNSFVVTVTEQNSAPQFLPLTTSNIVVNPGTTILLPNLATDSDIPIQTLTFAMIAGPTGAFVDPNVGIFAWRPSIQQAGTTNQIKIVASDSGFPSLSATQSFTIAVCSATAPKIESIQFTDGVSTLKINGIFGPDYVIETSTNLIDWQSSDTKAQPKTFPFLWSETTVSDRKKFYRVKLAP